MAIDSALLKWGLVLLIAGSLVGAIFWSPAYAAAVLGFLLMVLSEAL